MRARSWRNDAIEGADSASMAAPAAADPGTLPSLSAAPKPARLPKPAPAAAAGPCNLLLLLPSLLPGVAHA
eukprot:245216-Pelagomonas_calceolata.AAC.13